MPGLGIEPATLRSLARRSNQLSCAAATELRHRKLSYAAKNLEWVIRDAENVSHSRPIKLFKKIFNFI